MRPGAAHKVAGLIALRHYLSRCFASGRAGHVAWKPSLSNLVVPLPHNFQRRFLRDFVWQTNAHSIHTSLGRANSHEARRHELARRVISSCYTPSDAAQAMHSGYCGSASFAPELQHRSCLSRGARVRHHMAIHPSGPPTRARTRTQTHMCACEPMFARLRAYVCARAHVRPRVMSVSAHA